MTPPTGRVQGAGPIWLVRHAPTAWTGRRWCGRSDPPLTAIGRAAAARLAAAIRADVPPARRTDVIVLTSPFRRSIESARSIAKSLAAPVRIDADLVEIDFGTVDGLTWDELDAAHPALAASILSGAEPDWPGGETAAEVSARAWSAATRIRDVARSSAVVVVSHGGLLRSLARHLGVPLASGRFEPASVVRVDLGAVLAARA